MNCDGLIFLAGSCAYPTLEMLWRGRTHYSMALAGGVCLYLINKICCEKLADRKIFLRCVAGSAIITGVEFGIGVIFNDILKMNVWDYSDMPLNIFGQVCLPYSVLWLALTVPAMALCEMCKRSEILS